MVLQKYLHTAFFAFLLIFCANAYSQTSNPVTCPLAPQINNQLTSIWNTSLGSGIKKVFNERLAHNDIYALYDVQKQTQNILRAAIHCNNLKTLDDIAGIYLDSLTAIKQVGKFKMWVCAPGGLPGCIPSLVGKENVLISAQFLSGVSYLLRATVHLSPDTQYPNLISLHQQMPNIIREHLHRWGYSTKAFSAAAWGCADKKSYTHHEFMTKKRAKLLGKKPIHCNAITDSDILIATTLVNYAELRFKSNSPIAIGAEKNAANWFKAYLQNVLQTIRQRMQWAPGNGKKELRLVFDYGAWKDHPGMKAGGYSGEYVAILPAKTIPAQVLDQSHFTRMFHLLLSIKESTLLTTQSPYKAQWGSGISGRLLKHFANQLMYTYSIDPATDTPFLANYIDGMNGWYRLNDNGIYGHPPSSLTMATLLGGVGFLASCAHYNQDSGSSAIQAVSKKFLSKIEAYRGLSGYSSINMSQREALKSVLLTAQHGNVADTFATSTLASFYATLFCVTP